MSKNNYSTISESSGPGSVGPYLARVVSHLDRTYMGSLEVEILRPVGNDNTHGQVHRVKYMTPFGGISSADLSGTGNSYADTQKSYGMWFIPPDVGATVVIFFIDGDPKRGYWFGCVYDENMNFMVPGNPATTYNTTDRSKKVPVAEYNKNGLEKSQLESIVAHQVKPSHTPISTYLGKQGLADDPIRGYTTSGARREVPSAVFGISTPGPIDKTAPKKTFGKKDSTIQAPISRFGGTTFVMDDGDDKFTRKMPPDLGKMEYNDVENGDPDIHPEIPHNELVRLRTRTGHQILMHNSEDLIYICNARGTAWVELTSDGKIDVFCNDSISVHTMNDVNFTAARDINFTAGGDINLNAGGATKITSTGDSHINSANHYETAGAIHMNGDTKAAVAPKSNRVPTHEPYAGHENLDPMAVKPGKTKAKATPDVPSYTPTKMRDTFQQIKPAAEK